MNITLNDWTELQQDRDHWKEKATNMPSCAYCRGEIGTTLSSVWKEKEAQDKLDAARAVLTNLLESAEVRPGLQPGSESHMNFLIKGRLLEEARQALAL